MVQKNDFHARAKALAAEIAANRPALIRFAGGVTWRTHTARRRLRPRWPRKVALRITFPSFWLP